MKVMTVHMLSYRYSWYYLFRCTGIGIHRSRTFFSNGGQLKHRSGLDSRSWPSTLWLSCTKLSSICGQDTMHHWCVRLQSPQKLNLMLIQEAAVRLGSLWLAEIAVNVLPRQICVDHSLPGNPLSVQHSLPSPIFTVFSSWWSLWLIMLTCALPSFWVLELVTSGHLSSFPKPT